MPLEQLLLLLFLVAVPLLERLIRVMRERTAERASTTGTKPAAPPPRPRVPTPRALPAPPAPERQPRPAARVGAAPPQQPRRQGTVLQRVVTGGDLRRAIVLMEILGPCRALERGESSQHTFEGARGR